MRLTEISVNEKSDSKKEVIRTVYLFGRLLIKKNEKKVSSF